MITRDGDLCDFADLHHIYGRRFTGGLQICDLAISYDL
jgi:hypothetical protein